MNRFFYIEAAFMPEDVGVSPQLEKFHAGFHTDRCYDLWTTVSPGDTHIATGMALFYRAKLTDWISLGYLRPPQVMLVSQRFFNIIEPFNGNGVNWLTAHAELSHRKKMYDYRFLHFPEPQPSPIDYEKTVFAFTSEEGIFGYWEDEFKMHNFDEYVRLRTQLHKETLDALRNNKPNPRFFTLKSLAIRQDAPPLSVIQFDAAGFIVSEPLKNILEAAGITGVRFLPAEEYRNGLTKTKESTI